MKRTSELKAMAKEGLKGKRGQAFGALLLANLVSSIPLCNPAMMVGYAGYNNKLVRSKDSTIGDEFNGFSIFGKSLWLYIIVCIFTLLWSLLFIIPGIIKAFAYAMAPYILSENPQMTAREALRASIAMMKGKKGKLFVLGLSFIGWMLIGTITCGIGYIWIVPYMQATFAAFYLDAKEST